MLGARSIATALAEQVMDRCHALAQCTMEAGSITRAYGTSALIQARALVRQWMEAGGMAVREDPIGNLIGRYESGAANEATFLLGSHIDSVRNAGRYDGPLGVLVAIACVERLHAEGKRLPFAIEVVAFVDEEGLRFHASYLGSRVFAGVFDVHELSSTDADGASLAEAVEAMGGDTARLAGDEWRAANLLGYCEVHIEQGPVLEAKDLPVGVVTSIAGQSRGTVTFTGEAGHAGTVPMDLRRDALCAASEFILFAEHIARRWDGLVATVGEQTISPGVGNVIPGVATLSFDVRHRDDNRKAEACLLLEQRAREIAAVRHVAADWNEIQRHPSVPSSSRLVDSLAAAVEDVVGIVELMPSGAGHDTVSIAHLTPEIVMLFVRCKGGISHHPDESVDLTDVGTSIEVVSRLLRELPADRSTAEVEG